MARNHTYKLTSQLGLELAVMGFERRAVAGVPEVWSLPGDYRHMWARPLGVIELQVYAPTMNGVRQHVVITRFNSQMQSIPCGEERARELLHKALDRIQEREDGERRS